MMGAGELLAFLELLFEHSQERLVIVSIVASAMLVGCFWKRCDSWKYRCLSAASGLLAVFTITCCQPGNSDAACIAFIALVSAVILIAIRYRKQDQVLEDIACNNDQQNPNRNPSKALALLQSINQSDLIGLQRERYERYKVYTYHSLGNNRVAKELLEDPDSKLLMSPAFKHFFLHIIADEAGDCKGSQDQLSKALAHKDDKDTDAFTQLQLEHNQAVLHINKGQYVAANSELEKVIDRASELKVTNRDFLNSLYYNYVINLTRIGLPDNGEERGWEAIARYARLLNPSDPADTIALFNMKLLFMRQLGADTARKNELYRESLRDFVESTRFTKRQKVVGVASFGGVCWFDRLDPAPVIDFFVGNGDMLLGLDPADRYVSCSNLDSFLGGLIGNYADDGSAMLELAKLIDGYFRTTAASDLEAWERELPAEACRQRAHLLRERASLCLRRDDDKTAAKLLEEAIGLLEDNLLVLDALECRLRLAKLVVVHEPERAIEQVRTVEQRVEGMHGNPSLGYIYANVSLCYALANMRDDCVRTYDLATEHKIPMAHFNPGERMGMAISAFCARFFLFLSSLDRIKRNCERYALSEESRAWIACYPLVPGPGVALLLARFMGYASGVPLARRCMRAKDGSSVRTHCWLEFREAEIAFDPTIQSELGGRGQVYVIDKHPLVSINDIDVKRYEREGYVVQQLEQAVYLEGMLDPMTRSVIAEIGGTLEDITADASPSKQDLMEAYLHGVANVPIPEESR